MVGSVAASLVFDYFLKDHLGNVRMVLTEDQQSDMYPAATMETATAATEETFYSNLPATREAAPTGNGYPSNTPSCNVNVARVRGDGNKIGPAIVLKVMAGDKFNVMVNSWYKTNGASPGSSAGILTTLLSALSNGVGSLAGGKVTAGDLNNANAFNNGATQFLNNQNSGNNASKPKAYLNWILFDEQFNLVSSSSGFEQVGNDQEYKTHVKNDMPVDKNGFLYIYVSNETPNIDVFFDNLQVTHTRGPILEETHYYPFGLIMSGISSKANGGLENNKKFQGQEFTNNFDIDIYEFKYRMEDSQTGRFYQVDPLSDKYVHNSVYAFSEDKVTSHVELEGLEAVRTYDIPHPNNGESTQLRKPRPIVGNVIHVEPAFTLTVTKGKQFGVNAGPVGLEYNGGSKEVLKVTDVDPGKNVADKNKTISGSSLSLGVVTLGSESVSTSKTNNDKWNPITETTTEKTNFLTFGLKNTKLSAGIQNTETTTTTENRFGNIQSPGTYSGPQPAGIISSPDLPLKTSGTKFSIAAYYKVEVSINIKQMFINIFDNFNTGN